MTEADKDAQRNLDLKQVMENDWGRRVVWRIIQQCGVHGSVARVNEEKPGIPFESSVMYNAGQQDIGHWLTRKAKVANPAGFRLMHEEAEARFMEGKRNA